jgi:hypothetical protein
MKLIGVFSTAVLSLAIAAPVYAQQEQHDQQEENKDKPAEQKENKAQPEKSAKPEEKSAQPERNAKPEEKSAQQPERATKPEEKNAQQQDKNNKPEERNAQQQHAQPAKQAQRGGGRIPDDRYKANFGQQHTFHVSQGDYNNHRFQYGGYSFGFVGAWPSNWLYTQNVYVIDIDGVYYLCNPMYPGVNIALDVTL